MLEDQKKIQQTHEFFLKGGGSCSYDDEMLGDIDVPLKYKHLVK